MLGSLGTTIGALLARFSAQNELHSVPPDATAENTKASMLAEFFVASAIGSGMSCVP